MSISISGSGAITGATTSYSFDQSVSVGGTVTYEDVTNVDSVGIITARSGIEVTGGNIHIAGVGATIGVATAYIGSAVFAGDVQTTSLNSGPLSGFRNQIINGGFVLNERGEASYGADGVASYTLDRWYHASVPASSTGSSVSIAAGGPAKGINRMIRLSANTAGIQQGIETPNGNNGQFAVGSTWTLSVWSTVDLEAAGNVAFTPSFRSGISDVSNIPVTGATLAWVNTGEPADNGFSRYRMTFTVTANSTNTKNCVVITLPGGNELGGTAVDYAMAQLEPGPVATPFEHRPIGTELALCQRYYQKIDGTPTGTVTAYNSGNGQCRFIWSSARAVPMRANPIETGILSSISTTPSGTKDYWDYRTTFTSVNQDATLNNATADAEL